MQKIYIILKKHSESERKVSQDDLNDPENSSSEHRRGSWRLSPFLSVTQHAAQGRAGSY